MAAPDPDAPAVLRVWPDGRAVLVIDDHGGRPVEYLPAPLPVRPDPDGVTREAWAVGLARLDGLRGPYRVSRTHGGRMRCTCADTSFGRAARECRRCKHRYSLAALMDFARRITSMVSPRRRKPDEPSPGRPADQPREAATAAGQEAPEEAAAAPPQALSLADVAAALAAPFEPSEVKFKPQTISGNRALAVPFVDARVVQDRLDDVLGVFGWEDRYQPQADGSVLCLLTLHVDGLSRTKSDVGGQSEQPDEGDRAKAAVSDALKRAAVKFGVGRYLYRQRPRWVDYDPQKKQFVRQPVLAGVPAQPSAARRTAAPPAEEVPFFRRLQEFDAKLSHEGICKGGDLVKAVAAAGKASGYAADMTAWGDEEVKLARATASEFERRRLFEEVDRLLDRTGVGGESALHHVKAPRGRTLSQLDGKALRALVTWLRPLPDAPAAGNGRRAS